MGASVFVFLMGGRRAPRRFYSCLCGVYKRVMIYKLFRREYFTKNIALSLAFIY